MKRVKLLVIEPVGDGNLGRMTAIDPKVRVVDARKRPIDAGKHVKLLP